MPGKKAPVSCPKCGGDMWDNIAGKRNPKAPDYACKNKEGCGAGVWLDPAEKAALSATPARSNGAGPARPPVVLDKMMKACVKAAQAIGTELFKDGELTGVDHALTINMATTLFIARCKNDGILEVEKETLAKLAAKAEAERKAAEEAARKREEEERSRQPATADVGGPPLNYYGGEDLPF